MIRRGWISVPLLILIGLAAGFIWHTGRSLPQSVASHFDFSGAPNGFTSRLFYVRSMLAFAVVVPLLLNFAMSRLLRIPNARINMPNRDYWLAPERRASTIALLLQLMNVFAALLVIFLCYVHWCVVRANLAQPPALHNTWFLSGFGVFMFSVIAWMVALRRRFRRLSIVGAVRSIA